MSYLAGDDDIAVIGMSCRVAGANSPSELWDLLASSRDVQSEITRFNIKGYYHPDGGPRKGLTNVTRAYMMDDNAIDRFDNAFFHTTPNEAIAMDPQQRMLLEIAYEAVENAGIPLEDFTGTDTAVYAGTKDSCLKSDYVDSRAMELIYISDRYLATGTASCMAANRISYFFDLSGPSMTVDTACSSTMAALHQAVGGLQHGETKMALVCGAKLIISPDMFIPSSELGFLSPSGRCRSFDAAGDGYGRGEGALAILLKPLKEALAHRDSVRAVVKGTRLNQDGRTQGITLPSSEAQKLNMDALYSKIGISPNDVQYLEAHGTGTAAGDPLELCAINTVYGLSGVDRAQKLVVGSIKSNVGHLEACASLAGIIKTIECLERGIIPSQMHLTNPNPKINFRNIQIPCRMIEWPGTKDGIRRAAVNTFGAGGTNGHAILEAYPRSVPKPTMSSRSLLFKVSAASDDALGRLLLKYADYVETRRPNLGDLAYTLLCRRSNLRDLAFFTASSHKEFVRKLRAGSPRIYATVNEPVKKAIFLFTGQGAQWPGMGRTLIDNSQIFKSVLLECNKSLGALPDKPDWSIIDELSKSKQTTNIYQSEFSQPLCTALQLGLITLWRSWGLVPAAVVGHSSGEIAAAYAAGYLSLRDAIVTAYYRGLSLAKLASTVPNSKPKGSMCAVGMNEESAWSILEPFSSRVQMAAVNAPSSCTLSGDEDAIKDIVSLCKKSGTFCRELRVDLAYHSHHMLPVAPRYEEALMKAKVSALEVEVKCDMFSSVTGRKLGPEDLSPVYWKQNMISPVQLFPALTACMDYHPEATTVVEIGPHSALKGPAQEILRSLGRNSLEYFHTCLREKHDFETILESAGAMIAHGIPLNTPNINADEIIDGPNFKHEYGNVLTDLPSYQWDHSTPFWTESRISRNIRQRRFHRHQLLGSRYVEDTPLSPSWRNLLMLKEVPWLLGLREEGATIVPPTVFIFMALEAARQLQSSADAEAKSILLSGVKFEEFLPLALFKKSDTVIELHLTARKATEADVFRFEIFSMSDEGHGSSITCCSGKLQWTTTTTTVTRKDVARSQGPLLLQKSRIYTKDLPSKFEDLRIDANGSDGVFENSPSQHEHYCMDPLALDSIMSLPPVSLIGQNLPAMYKVALIERIEVPVVELGTISGRFNIDCRPIEACGLSSNIVVHSDSFCMVFTDVCYRVDHLIDQRPDLSSLFFAPVLLPDISKLSSAEPMSLVRCLELITHKWPMCDFGLSGMTQDDANFILKILPGTKLNERPRFRSIRISGAAVESDYERVQYVEEFDADAKFHALFEGGNLDLDGACGWLPPCGLVFLRADRAQEETLAESFVKICDVQGLPQHTWTLWRLNSDTTELHPGHRATVFACPDQKLSNIEGLPVTEVVCLDAEAIREFCKRSREERYDAIVLDCKEKSVITTFVGYEFVPWLQALLRSADSIMWITQRDSDDPYANVAGTLLRTLQSEKPFLKVTWLIFGNGVSELVMQSTISSVYHALLRGENEVRLEMKDSQLNILRYLPDDYLSANIGLLLPIPVSESLVSKDYELSLSAPQKPVILASYPDYSEEVGSDKIRVLVEASVVDPDDVATFHRVYKHTRGHGLGRFFAGRIISENCPAFPSGSQVAGWHIGAHRKYIETAPEHLHRHEESSPAVAAANYAAIAAALCIVDGVARARAGDTFDVQVDGIFGEAIVNFCRETGAVVLESQRDIRADFTVSVGMSGGLLVNGLPVDIDKYVESAHGAMAIVRAWETKGTFASRLPNFELSDYEAAFQATYDDAYSSVLVHTHLEKIESSVAVYRKTDRLISGEGAYVIIGGLGGLGRFVCSWMVANGAKRLVVISRNGLQSDEAHETFTSINALDASMEIIKADACDRRAMAEALARVRQTGPIKGVINMAMLLGDAPMAEMKGWQWDRALRLKIDSSWNLHQETLQDSLDFFILFSSIASVLGNRNQGGYNVGNTFLNALASYRRSLGLTAVSIALGAMTEIGILHELGRRDLPQTLSRSGLSPLGKFHLAKIMEAAIVESHRPDRALIVTGLEIFERVDGKLIGSQDQTQLYWTEVPEFGFLQSHRLSSVKGELNAQSHSLRERMQMLDEKQAIAIGLEAFTGFLEQLLGFESKRFNPSERLAMYGLDSLSGVSCQYWLCKEMAADVSVADVLNTTSIAQLVTLAYQRPVSETSR